MLPSSIHLKPKAVHLTTPQAMLQRRDITQHAVDLSLFMAMAVGYDSGDIRL